MQKKGIMAVPLSQACPESTTLMPRDAVIWNWGILQEKYLNPQQSPTFWTPDSQVLSLLTKRDGRILSPLNIRKQNILVASVTSAFISWVCRQGPRCQPSVCSEQGLRGSRELGTDPNLSSKSFWPSNSWGLMPSGTVVACRMPHHHPCSKRPPTSRAQLEEENHLPEKPRKKDIASTRLFGFAGNEKWVRLVQRSNKWALVTVKESSTYQGILACVS